MLKSEKIAAVIFDVDGTILDSMPMWMHVSERYLATLGIVSDEDLDKRFLAETIEVVAAYMKQKFSLPLTEEEIQQGIQKVVSDFYFYQAQMKPGLKELIISLHEKKIPMVVASSGIKELIEAAFTRLDILQYFGAVLTGNKNDTGVFEQCLDVLGTKPEETFVFEDGIHAIKTAKKMGLKTVAVKDVQDNYAEIALLADYELEDFCAR